MALRYLNIPNFVGVWALTPTNILRFFSNLGAIFMGVIYRPSLKIGFVGLVVQELWPLITNFTSGRVYFVTVFHFCCLLYSIMNSFHICSLQVCQSLKTIWVKICQYSIGCSTTHVMDFIIIINNINIDFKIGRL